jgi:transcriptional regulator with GAF, ATPase, and Fis domain
MQRASERPSGSEPVWFRFHGRDVAREAQLRESLGRAGVQLTTSGNGGQGQHAILGFGETDDDLIAAARALLLRAGGSVLAVATSASAIENGIAWRLLHGGVADVIVCDGPAAAGQVAAKLERWFAIDALMATVLAGESLAGESAAWLGLLRKVVEAARFSTAPVLLTGESGTGKEVLARLVHAAGCHPGQRRELVTVDCSTLIPELSGSELFGHERGAFTGAHVARDGAFALADEATLFLDEVGELPLPLQAQLLRVIQEKTYKRVGANVWQKTNFRLVCATNRDLAELVRQGQFRLDLFHRIAGWEFRTLPLCERRGDVLPLARHALSTFSPDTPGFDDAVCQYLLNRAYAGNIRELRQLVQRMASRHAGPGPITAGDIPGEDRPPDGGPPRAWPDERLDRAIADAVTLGVPLREISAAASTAAIRIALQCEGGNLQRAAKRLGVTDRALQLRRAAGSLPD